jgi:glucose-6-phosphate dehydrogenase assembly protein OpcA
MMIDLAETTTGRIHEAIHQARQRLGGPASGMVLTLVIVTDEAAQYDAVRSASEAAREHPCRVLAVITRRPEAGSRLDAEIRVGESGPGEVVLLRMYGALGEHADSVVTPLLMPDTPVVTWWPGTPPDVPFRSPLGALAQRRITDAAAAASPHDCLASLASHYKPGDTDLSWTRATSWRSLLAATLDQPHGAISGGRVEAERGNPSADLIASWLSVRLGVPFENRISGGPGVTGVIFDTSDGEMTLTRPDGRLAVLRRPGEPERRVALHRRDTAELLSEELRRLDPDEVYAETIAPFVSVPAPAEVKRNGGSSRKRVTASGDAPRKEAEAPRKDRAR